MSSPRDFNSMLETTSQVLETAQFNDDKRNCKKLTAMRTTGLF